MTADEFYLKHRLAEALLENHRLRAELATRQWQPIETAPKDGTEILAYEPIHDLKGELSDHNVDNMRWDGNRKWSDGDFHFHKPTHWMPLPDPPQETEG